MWKSVLTELIVTYELVGGLREKILAILQKNSKLLFTSFRENNYYLLATEFDERYFCYYPQPISRNSALESANHN